MSYREFSLQYKLNAIRMMHAGDKSISDLARELGVPRNVLYLWRRELTGDVLHASYTKLDSGEWGIRVKGGTVSAGQTIQVTKRSRAVKSETIKAVLWTDAGVSVCSIVQELTSPRTPAGNWRKKCVTGGASTAVDPHRLDPLIDLMVDAVLRDIENDAD